MVTHIRYETEQRIWSEGVEMVEQELLVRKMKCGAVVDNIPAGKLG